MKNDLERMSIGNGAGSIKYPDQVARACKSPMSRIMVGSITLLPRDGNIGDVYYFHPQNFWSLNSLGLPNPGMEAYKKLLPEMVCVAHGAGKELWTSVAGFSPAEYAQMAVDCFGCGVDGVELNLSCPNVWKGDERKEIPSLNPELIREIVNTVHSLTYDKFGGVRFESIENSITIKLSPVEDDSRQEEIAEAILDTVEEVTLSNTVPDAQGLRVDGKPALAFRSDDADHHIKHRGGLAGAAVLKPNLVFVSRMKQLLGEDISVIACGGIFTGADAVRYIEAGACGIQCTTSYLEFKEQIFVDILMQLSDLVSV